jgi:hypothetical protein
MFAAEHALELGYPDIFFNCLKVLGHFLLGIMILFLYRHFKQQLSLFDCRPGAFPAVDNFLNLPELLLGLLGTLSIFPEIRGKGLAFELFELIFFAG